jgi:hypothetical protein
MRFSGMGVEQTAHLGLVMLIELFALAYRNATVWGFEFSPMMQAFLVPALAAVAEVFGVV